MTRSRRATGGASASAVWLILLILLLIILLLILRNCESPPGEDPQEPVDNKVVFVTSQTFSGNLGNFAGADAKCQAAAEAAGLSGSFKAWISGRPDWTGNGGGTQNVAQRMTHSSSPYVLTTGTKVADDWADLTDGSLDHGIDRDENGATASGSVWTNTKTDGDAFDHRRDCGPGGSQSDVWGSADQFESGHFGTAGDSGATWTTNTNTGCNNSFRLYCFEQ